MNIISKSGKSKFSSQHRHPPSNNAQKEGSRKRKVSTAASASDLRSRESQMDLVSSTGTTKSRTQGGKKNDDFLHNLFFGDSSSKRQKTTRSDTNNLDVKLSFRANFE